MDRVEREDMSHLTSHPLTEPVAALDSVQVGPDWTGALCREIGNPELWFPTSEHGKPVDWDTPRAICQRCPLREACLEYAMGWEYSRVGEQRYGMWGALDPWERATIARQRRSLSGRSSIERLNRGVDNDKFA